MHQLETLLEATMDKTFDKFEIYTLRNILMVPNELTGWMRLGHYEVSEREFSVLCAVRQHDTFAVVYLCYCCCLSSTYDHRHRNAEQPIRSVIHKPVIGRSVVALMTSSESPLVVCF